MTAMLFCWKVVLETKTSFSYVSEEYLDPDTAPYLDIANQTGRSIEIPPQAKKVSKNGLTKVIR